MTFMNGRIGNVVDQKGAAPGRPERHRLHERCFRQRRFPRRDPTGRRRPQRVRLLPDARADDPQLDLHATARRWTCSSLRGDWWGQPPYGNITLENNVFGHSVNGSGWHYYGLYWSNDKFENVRVVNNTFENSVILDNIGSGPYSGVWANNIGGGWSCLPGVTYRNNVGKSCGPSDKAVNPAVSCFPPACNPGATAAYRWANPSAGDFHLRAGSPAIDAGSPEYAPRTDRDGWLRLGTPDAGAYEFGAGPDSRAGPQAADLAGRAQEAAQVPGPASSSAGDLQARAAPLPLACSATGRPVQARPCLRPGDASAACPSASSSSDARPRHGAASRHAPQGAAPEAGSLPRQDRRCRTQGSREDRSGPHAARPPIAQDRGAPRRSVVRRRCRSRRAFLRRSSGQRGARLPAAPK